jgi:hypothetical protein
MNKYEHVLIFSAERSTIPSEVNDLASAAVKLALENNNIPHIETLGVYQGVSERSFIVPATYRSIVEKLCDRYKQDCYLERDVHNVCSLNFPDKVEFIGKMELISETEAQSVDHTYRPDTGEYYTIR